MQMLKSFVIAFSMYSKLPMPKVEWSPGNMRYVMFFFPFTGAVIGGGSYLWYVFASNSHLSQVLTSSILVLLPLIVSGGIHMDGFMDTMDALSSYRSKSEKLRILKDPNTGAFAVMGCVGYCILTFGLWFEVEQKQMPFIALGFFLSRVLSALSVVSFPIAKDSGLVHLFSSEAKKRSNRYLILSLLLVSLVILLLLDVTLGAMILLVTLLCYLYYYRMAVKEFGGITGDIAGFFVQICELFILITAAMGGKLCI